MLKTIRLELARTKEFPSGNPRCGYEFKAPLDAKGLTFVHPDGELDAELSCNDCHTGGIQK